MGHNIDLQELLGLPEYVRCPKCKELTKAWFDEYDIDCGKPQAIGGIMTLDIQCSHCEEDFEFRVIIKTEELKLEVK